MSGVQKPLQVILPRKETEPFLSRWDFRLGPEYLLGGARTGRGSAVVLTQARLCVCLLPAPRSPLHPPAIWLQRRSWKTQGMFSLTLHGHLVTLTAGGWQQPMSTRATGLRSSRNKFGLLGSDLL